MWCSHAYAHASADAACRLPRNLKGSDLVIYSIFKHLGYEVAARPVLQGDFDDYYEREEPEDESGDEAEEYSNNKRDTKNTETEKEVARRQVCKGEADLVGTTLRPLVLDVDGLEEPDFDIVRSLT